ncbi:MAG: thermopsin family protease, partial [Candidatus Lutacidiplasmatales archaeon]
VYSSTYYAAVASGYPGSPVTLSLPTTILARIVASNASGTPHVGIEYNDGQGWVIFDNVTFPFLTNGVNHGFLVTGFQYNPSGTYLDAEWDVCGPGGGLTQKLGSSSLDMGLSYWNGHNFQAVRSAFDFGANTGESMSNVVDHFGGSNSTGAVFGHVVNGTGSLGPLYGSADVATLRISTGSQSSGAIVLNGVVVPYIGALANLTLAPGGYQIVLTANGSYVNGMDVNLTAGEFRSMTLAPIPTYPLRFVSVGLPPQTGWSVNVSGALVSGGNSLLTLPVHNGTYDYVVSGVPGFAPGSYRGAVRVSGTVVNVTIVWTEWRYAAVFVAENDPGGVTWSVVVDGVSVSGSGGQLSTQLPNGSFPFVASADAAVLLSPSSGTVNVSAGVVQVDIGFSPAPGVFQGTLSPGTAALTINGQPVSVDNGTFNVSLVAGTYTVVASLQGFVTFKQIVTIVAGATAVDPITLLPLSGGPTGTSGPGGAFPLPGGLWLWAALGAGVVLLAAAVLLHRRRNAPPRTPAR